MKPKKNVIGEVYGRLTITGDAPYRSKDRRVYVSCTCGSSKDVLLGDLRRGDTVSCGCFLTEVITTHGDSYTRLYKIYKGMMNRCYLKTQSQYRLYGGRGIVVCGAWRDSYEAFRDWAVVSGYDDSLTIERRQVNGNYEPDNCGWIPMEFQHRNKQAIKGSSSQYIGVSKCKQTGRWLAKFKIGQAQKNLGRYDTELEAAQARDQYIVDNGYTNFRLNGVLP